MIPLKVRPAPQYRSKKPKVKESDKSLPALPAAPKNPNCRCNSRYHPLNLNTPNCLNCGFVLCSENTKPDCPFCHKPLHTNEFYSSNEEFSKANSNLTRLLSYQSNAAVRTKIIDQVSDFTLPGQPISSWASPEEQEKIKKAQAKQLRKMEQQQAELSGRDSKFFSIDLQGNKVFLSEEKGPTFEELEQGREFENPTGHSSQESLSSGHIGAIDPDVIKKSQHHKRQLIKPSSILQEKLSNELKKITPPKLKELVAADDNKDSRLQVSKDAEDQLSYDII